LFRKTNIPSFGVGALSDRQLSTRIDFDLKKGIEGKESTLLTTNSVCVGARPPGSIAEAGIVSITHCILLGPLSMS